MHRIYLDHAATTPVRPEVLQSMLPFFTDSGYNPSSVHSEGRVARAAVEQARERVAGVLGAKPKEIVFTASGSEADNLAILGVARALRPRGRHLVSAVTEHHAVLHALDALRREDWDVTLLPVDAGGLVDAARFERALRDDTVLASIAYANNEIGTIQPVAQLASLARKRGVLFHTDAVQAPMFLPLDVRDLGVDLLSLAAHKFYGPKGIGVLYVRGGTPLEALVHGGGQEFGLRAGTENVAAIAGLARALELAAAERAESANRVGCLRDRLQALIGENMADVRVNGARDARLPNNLNISILGVQSDRLLAQLDIEGLAVSAGSACSSGVVEPSHVIAALGLPEEWSGGVLRFSLGKTTTAQEIPRAAMILARAVESQRSAFGFSNKAEQGIVGSRPSILDGGRS